MSATVKRTRAAQALINDLPEYMDNTLGLRTRVEDAIPLIEEQAAAEARRELRPTLTQFETLLALLASYPENITFRGEARTAFAQQVLDIFEDPSR